MPNPYAARNLFSYGCPFPAVWETRPLSGFASPPSVHPPARKHGRIAVCRVALGLKPLSLPRALARLFCIGTCWHDCGALSNGSIQRRYCRALALLHGISVIAGHDRGASSKAITKTDSHTLSVTVHHVHLPSLSLSLPLSLTRFLALP